MFVPSELTITEADIDRELTKRFPVERRIEVLEFTVAAPRVELLPAENRVATEFDATVRIAGAAYSGHLRVDYALRWDADAHALVADRLHVDRFDLGAEGGALHGRLRHVAEPAIVPLLGGIELYRPKPEMLERLRAAGLRPGAVTVMPHGIRIALDAVR